MILNTLQSMLQSVRLALNETPARNCSSIQVHQAIAADHVFSIAFESVFETGPVASIRIGSDKDFAADRGVVGDSALQLFTEALPAALAGLLKHPGSLADQWPWRRTGAKLRSPAQRCYRFDVVTDLGMFSLFAELNSNVGIRSLEDPHYLLELVKELKLKEQLGRSVADKSHEIKRYLDFLRRTEIDVQVELPAAVDSAFCEGTYVKQGADGNDSLVCLSLGGLDEATIRRLNGQPINVFFGILGRLFQFEATATPYPALALDGDSELPVVALAYPEVISIGQRRASFRVTPGHELTVEIGPIFPDSNSQRLEALASSEARVIDISFTGLKAMAQIDALLDVLDQKDEVLCRIDLPSRFGTAELLGVVRRAVKTRSSRYGLQHDLGIEFMRSDERNQAGLEQVRQFVLAEQRRALRERAHAVVR